jgi:hypothetical protein
MLAERIRGPTMRKIRISDLESVRAHKPEGYVEDVLSLGSVTDGVLTLQDSAYAQLRQKYGAVRKSNLSKVTEWPIWAKALKQFSASDDKGIGDVVARMIGDENSMKFKAWYLATFGRSCGCTGRRERWNKQYPL